MTWAVWREYPDSPEKGRLYHGYGDDDWRAGIENAKVYYDTTEAYDLMRRLRKRGVHHGVEQIPVKRLTLRIPPGLNNRVAAAAASRGMNVNQFIIACLEADTPT